MPDYNPDSLDAVLARFEAKFDSHVANTETFRKDLKGSLDDHSTRIGKLEGDKKKLFGIAIGSGLGAGSLGTALHKMFGGQ